MSRFFVTCARGVEELTAQELEEVGATKIEPVMGGLFFEGDQDVLYRAHLWLRTGNRILLPLRSFTARSPDELYENLVKFKWETFFTGKLTFAVDCTISGRNSITLNHSHYARLRAKDAIVDRLREKTGDRPDVDTENPDLRIVIYIRDGVATLNMDATGEALHNRGYRSHHAEAPLKETLAAAILMLSGWDAETPVMDAMCGSGTILAEAALIASNTAPGLGRETFAFMKWPDFHAPRWEKIRQEAIDEQTELPDGMFIARDQDRDAVKQVQFAFKVLGFENALDAKQAKFEDFVKPEGVEKAILVMNPPYGERLGNEEELIPLYKSMGDTFKQKLKGWKAAVFTGSPILLKSIGLKTDRRYPLWNGGIECRLATYSMYEGTKKLKAAAE
jgi:putative N6-adenine-specific DNA methylase